MSFYPTSPPFGGGAGTLPTGGGSYPTTGQDPRTGREFLFDVAENFADDFADWVFGDDRSTAEGQDPRTGSQNASTGSNGATADPASTVLTASDLNTTLILVAVIAAFALFQFSD
jgi:hypothetical protein